MFNNKLLNVIYNFVLNNEIRDKNKFIKMNMASRFYKYWNVKKKTNKKKNSQPLNQKLIVWNLH